MVWEIMLSGRRLYVSDPPVDYILICGSGGSTISIDERCIALSNLAGGFECYTLNDRERIYMVNLNASGSIPTSVLFNPNGSLMFGGSSGAVYIASGMPPTIKHSLKCEGERSLWLKIRDITTTFFHTGDEVVSVLVS